MEKLCSSCVEDEGIDGKKKSMESGEMSSFRENECGRGDVMSCVSKQ
jgi:hypothetical protein